MRVYIAGRIRGNKTYLRDFASAAQKLRIEGHSVYNPAAANLESLGLSRIMSVVLPHVCESDAVFMLRGWWRSGGARIEWLLARYLGLKIIYQ